jgi:hypothetical protein
MVIEGLLFLVALAALVFVVRAITVYRNENYQILERVEQLEERVLPQHNEYHYYFKPVAKKKED